MSTKGESPRANVEIKARCPDLDAAREIFLAGNVRIRLDRVVGLGSFAELEAVFDPATAAEAAEVAKVDGLMRELGVREEDLVPGSYETLVAARDRPS